MTVGHVVDRITISGVEVFGRHGVHPEERRDGQRFVVDVVLEADLAAAVASDDLADTLDYGAVASGVAEVVAGDPCELIEAVAGRVADRCLADPRVAAVEVTLHKPDAPLPVPATDVAVTLRRTRS